MSEGTEIGWLSSRFGDLCLRIVNGGTPDTSNSAYWNGMTPWITGADFRANGIGAFRRFISEAGIQSSATSIVKKGNLLVVTRTGVGKLAIAPCDIAISQDITGVYVNVDKIETEFTYYLLSRELDELKKLNQGTSINGIVRSDLEKHIVQFPSEKQAQRKIVEILRVTDTVIEKTEALIAKYRQIKAGLMHDLFTRGVLPSGQLRPPREQAPELYQETAIGWIPKDWRVARVGDLCSLITKGATPPNTEMWENGDGIRFLRVDNLGFDGQFNFEASSYRISRHTHMKLLSRSVCLPGDVLMNIVGPPLGKVALMTDDASEININQAIAVFRPCTELSSQFLLQWLISDNVKQWIIRRAKQTSGQLNVTLAMCQNLTIPHMGIEEQVHIEQILQSAEMLVRVETLRYGKLKNQKLGLMQDLLTGKVAVQVDEAEATHA